jgi:hypothetical protein
MYRQLRPAFVFIFIWVQIHIARCFSRVIEDNSIIIHIDEGGAAGLVADNLKRLILGPQILN